MLIRRDTRADDGGLRFVRFIAQKAVLKISLFWMRVFMA